MSPWFREGSLEREVECGAGQHSRGALGTSEMAPLCECSSRAGVMGIHHPALAVHWTVTCNGIPLPDSGSIVSLDSGEGSYSLCTSVSPLGTGILPIGVIAN